MKRRTPFEKWLNDKWYGKDNPPSEWRTQCYWSDNTTGWEIEAAMREAFNAGRRSRKAKK